MVLNSSRLLSVTAAAALIAACGGGSSGGGNESGRAVPLTTNADTQFFFHEPQSAAADAALIATGTTFIARQDLVRGFKVHARVVDPLATPLLAQSIHIETPRYAGRISRADAAAFTLTGLVRMAKDDYTLTLGYIAKPTANGADGSSNAAPAGDLGFASMQ